MTYNCVSGGIGMPLVKEIINWTIISRVFYTEYLRLTKNNEASMTDIGGNLNRLLDEAQKMQDRMKKAQEELIQLTVEGKSGGGMVKVRMNGRHDVTKVTIARSLLNEEVEMLEDLVAAAVNDAVRQVEKVSKEKINQLTAGLNIPADFMKDEDQA